MSWFSKRPAPNPPGGEITARREHVQTAKSSNREGTLTVRGEEHIITIDNGRYHSMYTSRLYLRRSDLPTIIAMLQAEVNS